MSNTKIIAFEGIDGSGKTVQFLKLKERLENGGASVATKEYPVYDGFFGRTIGKLLSGTEGLDANDVDARSMALWFALDRFEDLKSENLEVFDYVLINRYVLSNMVYQSVRHQDSDFSFVEWVHELEHVVLGSPVPDAYVFFDVDENQAASNVLKKGYRDYVGERMDVYEAAFNMQRLWRRRYYECAERYDNIIVIECMKDGVMLKPEAITDMVFNALLNRGLI